MQKLPSSERLREGRNFPCLGRFHGMITGIDLRVDTGAIASIGRGIRRPNRMTISSGRIAMDKSVEAYIVDDQEAGLFRRDRRAFTDPGCLEQERRRIFEKCWIYVGHDSEVPHAGDFRSRRLRPADFSPWRRRRDPRMFDTCTHRGTMVCRQKFGNTKTFQCPYHAWTFNSRGQLIGVSGENRTAKRFR